MNRVGPFQPSEEEFTTLIRLEFYESSRLMIQSASSAGGAIASPLSFFRRASSQAFGAGTGESSGIIRSIYLN
jgi:hypothetical protein